MGSMIEFARPDGGKAPGYLAAAPARAAAGIVLFSEWWGLEAHMLETAGKLAEAGYDVLVPDLYRGRVAATGDEANHLMQGLDFGDAVAQDARGAAAYLRERGARKVAAMGYCMGGALAMLCAMKLDDFDAAVVFYGFPPPEAGDPGTIKIPLLGHWARHDEFFNIARVDEIERRLKEAGTPFEFHRYDAKHAFCNPGGIGNHHPEHAGAAWRHTLAFLNRTLNA